MGKCLAMGALMRYGGWIMTISKHARIRPQQRAISSVAHIYFLISTGRRNTTGEVVSGAGLASEANRTLTSI